MSRTTLSLGGLLVALALAVGSMPESALDRTFTEVAEQVEAAGELCPDGTEVIPLWQGEYPSPVVQVKEAVTLPAAEHQCAPPTGECTVSPGLYHPWAEGSQASVVVTQRLEALVATELASMGEEGESVWVIAPGDVIEIGAYFGEGICSVRFEVVQSPMECPMPGETWKELPGPAFEERQLFKTDCAEGGTGWMEVDASLFARPEVTEGVITGWGEVAAEGAEGVF